MNNIIVIGNGSSVLDYKLQSEIDQFDHVARFNDFKIEGYESHIGTKTTIWARSNSNRTKHRDTKSFQKIILISPEWNYQNIAKLVKQYPQAITIPREIPLNLQNELGLPGRVIDRKRFKHKRGWPSSGLILLSYLLTKFETIYIHGFDFFKDVEGSARHYYNNKEKMEVTHVHNGQKEENWVNEKIKEGKIIKLIDIVNGNK